MRIEITITRGVNMSNGGIEIDGERDYEVTVEIDSDGIADRYGYTDGGAGEEFVLTADEIDRVYDLRDHAQ